ncbi:MAG TPA: endopeptidase La [Geobacterales bacterium]|nr:endopeptidase La [Geobacterales bacterium]
MAEASHYAVPEITPVHLLRELVAFPFMVVTLFLRPEEVATFEQAMEHQRYVALIKGREEQGEVVSPHEIGTLCRLNQLNRFADGSGRVVVDGLCRVRVVEITARSPVLLARLAEINEFSEKSLVSEALVQSMVSLLKIALSLGRPLPEDVLKLIDHIENPARLSDLVALYLNPPLSELQAVLETIDPIERLKKVYGLLMAEVQRLQVKGEVESEVTKKVGKSQKDFLLREQMRQIQEELGENDPRSSDLGELKRKIRLAIMPEEVQKVADREMKRLESIPPSSPEYTVARTYLDYLAGLPWQFSTPDNLDITQAQHVLDDDHYDLKKVKERIIEYLAVRSLRQHMKGPILCFIGPPGVGKTSLGRSIARSLGRKFIRVSLGGMRDEAEIRGHRRTYIGALPGRIIQEIYRCGSNNPVFMLDEVDKIGADFRGDPASALLEVLDPEQNFSFTDHYLDLPFDLSRVMFIATANQLDPVPAPLKDRMEVIPLAGYTEEEKVQIALRFLVPKEIEENGLAEASPEFSAESLQRIVTNYTREAGVRTLQRQIASVCRKLATERVKGEKLRTPVTPALVEELLGPRKFFSEVTAAEDRAGVATGLAWTESGGDIIFVEATRMKGKGELILTGSLGEVMRESARAALSFFRAHATEWGVAEASFDKIDIHIHVPAGSIPKDGPSAGITMLVALVSLFTGRPASRQVAMTGEISLTGRVLPIGGVKEKVLAAHRAGVRTVILPQRNRDDLEEVPPTVLKEMTIMFVDDGREAVAKVLT